MAQSVNELASQCVRCGLCLPHCPTYQLNQEEPESPRGRIAMLAANARAELEWQQSLQQHVDQCLACGHCQRVCPAQVSYEELLIKGRRLLADQHALSWKKKTAIHLIETPILRKSVFFVVRFLQKMHLWRPAIFLTNLFSTKLASAMALVPRLLRSQTQLLTSKKSIPVLLFPGCTGENLGKATFVAAKKILTHLGYYVILPPKSPCCGALSAHAGMLERTAKNTAQAISNFCIKNNIQHIISFATGCGSFSQVMQNSMGFTQTTDIQQFILSHNPEKFFQASARKLRIAVHSPCTQTNGLGDASLSYNLLKCASNAELIRFGEQSCCGASGLYMFEHTEISQRLVAQLLTEELLKNCDVIVTSNIGCQLQFQYFLRQKNIDLPVCHPIEILAFV